MNWPTLRTALVAFVVRGTGLAATSVEWRDGPRTMGTFPKASLFVKGIQALGVDLVSYVDKGDGSGNIAPVVSGNRKFTLEVEIQSRRATAGLDAVALAERLRTWCRMPSVLAALDAANIAVIQVLPLLDISSVGDDRQEGRVLLEIQLSTLEREGDTSPSGSTSFIERAHVASTLTGTEEQIDTTLPTT